MISIEIAPSGVRPYHLKKEGPEHGVYVRVGSTNRRADLALIAEMKRSVSLRTFDEEPVGRADSEEIDFPAASELFSPYRKLRPVDLETLSLMVKVGRKTAPTVGGILLFGKNPAKYFPDAWLQCGRFAGNDKTHIADSVEHRGSGIQRMLSACREAGLPDPQFLEVGFRFRVTFGLRRESSVKYDEKDQAIIVLLVKNPEGLSTSAIAGKMSLTSRTIRTRLIALLEKGVVSVMGQGPQDPRRRYVLVHNVPA